MNILGKFTAGAARFGLEVMCRIDKSQLKKVPRRGPLIAYSNHTGSVEVPILFTELLPRPVTGLAKIESWDNWFLHRIFNLWEVIPIRRGELDMTAMRRSFKALEEGYILGISPEGTRSKTGALIQAHPGIAMLALHSRAPLLPIANWGGEKFMSNLKRLKRTDFKIAVGSPFTLDTHGERVSAEVRQKIADEMMYEVARLLPEQYRGAYSDLEHATRDYLKYPS